MGSHHDSDGILCILKIQFSSASTTSYERNVSVSEEKQKRMSKQLFFCA